MILSVIDGGGGGGGEGSTCSSISRESARKQSQVLSFTDLSIEGAQRELFTCKQSTIMLHCQMFKIPVRNI